MSGPLHKNNFTYIRLDNSNLNRDSRTLAHLTEKSKIIVVGHGAPGSSQISSDDGATRISTEDLAAYISRNVDKTRIAPKVAFKGLRERAAKANSSDRFADPNGLTDLMRRLTIQLCVCSAADSGGNGESSFMRTLFDQAFSKGLNINVVGYHTIVLSNPATVTYRVPLLFGMPMVLNTPDTDLHKIFPKGGVDFDSIKNEEIFEKTARDTRLLHKVVYNIDHRGGVNYDKNWKEHYRVDVLEQLKTELSRDEWATKGKAKLFWTKVPEGITQLRALFRNSTPESFAAYDPTAHKKNIEDALIIINARLAITYKTRIRNEETSAFYRRYKEALEMCV